MIRFFWGYRRYEPVSIGQRMYVAERGVWVCDVWVCGRVGVWVLDGKCGESEAEVLGLKMGSVGGQTVVTNATS